MMRRVLIFTFVAAGTVLPVLAQSDDSYDGGTTISSGTLEVNNTSSSTTTAATNTGGLTLAGAGTLDLNGANTYTGGTIVSTGTLALTGVNSLSTTTTVIGGTLTLTGANTYDGTTTVSTGTLQLGNVSSGTISGTDGGTLTLSNGVLTLTGNTLGASGTTLVGGTYVQSNPNTLSLLSGTANGLTSTVADADTISGDVNVSSGTLQVNGGQGLGTGSITVQTGATLSLNGQSAGSGTFTEVNIGNSVTINGTGTGGQGALTGINGGGAVSGTVTLASNSSVGNSAQNSLSLGSIVLAGNTLTVGNGSGTFGLTGNISGTGGLVVSGLFVGIYGGNNTFTGTTDVTSGSQLYCSDSTGTALTGNLTIEDGGYVADFLGNQFTASTVVTLNGSAKLNLTNVANRTAAETIAGLQGTSATSVVTALLSGNTSCDTTLTLAGTGSYTYAGQISDTTYGVYDGLYVAPAVVSLVKEGSGTQILSGAITYYGPTTVNAGALVFTQGMSTTQWITTAIGATLNLAHGDFSTPGAITNNGTMVIGNGVTVSSGGGFTNNGTLDLRHNPTFVLPANFVNNGTILYATPQTFSTWATTKITSAGNQAAAAAPMQDAVPNVMKFLCDIDPTHPMTATDRAALPTFAVATDGSLTLTFRKSPIQTGLAVSVQTSSDLVHWTTMPQSQTPSPTTCTMQQVGTDMMTNDDVMQVSVQPSGAVTQFIRLGVATP